MAIAGVLGASVWIGLFAFRHVEYSNELWWQFGLDAQASRFLRGSIGAAILLLLVAPARLLIAAPHEVAEPTDVPDCTAPATGLRHSPRVSLHDLGHMRT